MGWDAFNRIMEYAMVALVLVGLWAWQRRRNRRPGAAATLPADHLVTVTTGPEPVTPDQVQALARRVAAALEGTGAGQYDGHRIDGGGEAMFRLHGPDADRLFALVAPVFRADPITAQGQAILRYGPDPASAEQRIALGTR